MRYKVEGRRHKVGGLGLKSMIPHAGGFLMMAGMIVAGSDGSWFPWANFAAAAVMCCGARMVCRFE